MSRLLKVLRWLTAAGTVLVLLLIAWQCVDIYLVGNSSANLDANGIHLQDVFRMDDVADRLSRFVLPLAVYGALVLLSVIMHMLYGQGRMAKQDAVSKTAFNVQSGKEHANQSVRLPAIRIVLFGVAVLFIVLGVMNSGWYDVLVKAINICTECIGLG